MKIQNTGKIIEELDEFLATKAPLLDTNSKYLALYLTPIGKNAKNRKAHNVYFQVKQKLLKYHIESQCIETAKMLETIDSFNGLMPYSGTYVNLGNNTYLLCNNTRYENCGFNPRDGYPFPVKIKIECPNKGGQPIDTKVVADLIEQVYQFSRIYWKSVKQQHLPVTVKYPEMLAEIVSHFQGGAMPSPQSNLWFL